MNAKQARNDLPAVTVRMPNGKVYPARTTGRLNPQATVSVSYVGSDAMSLADFGGAPWFDLQVAWETVARSATNGTPITY